MYTGWRHESNGSWVRWFRKDWALTVVEKEGLYVGTLEFRGLEVHKVFEKELVTCQLILQGHSQSYFQTLSDLVCKV